MSADTAADAAAAAADDARDDALDQAISNCEVGSEQWDEQSANSASQQSDQEVNNDALSNYEGDPKDKKNNEPNKRKGGSTKESDPSNFITWIQKLFTAKVGFTYWVSPHSQHTFTFENDIISNSFKDAQGVDNARDYFYNKYKGVKNLNGASVTNYDAGFGFSGVWHAELDPIQQFVGNYTINIFSNGKKLTYNLTNVTSMKSATYKVLPAYNGNLPGSNYTQVIIFSEPIDFKRISK